MSSFKQRITRIQGLSDTRRLPRLGIIRLGLKVQSEKTGKEYPRETDYFVCPKEVQSFYGEKPKELDVMLPLNEIDDVFPQAYKFYGKSKGLKCQGDGQIAYRVISKSKGMEEVECPCELFEEGKCKQNGTLMVILPKVSMGGIYQIRTGSYHSIVDVNSGLDYVQALIGRFALIPLKLRRVKTETHHDEKKQNHFTLQIVFDGNIDILNQLRENQTRLLTGPQYVMPEPYDDNPATDPIDIVEDEEKQEQNADPFTEKQLKMIRAKIGDIETLSKAEKEELYQWIKKEKAETIEIKGKVVITKQSASKIIDNFDSIYENFVETKLSQPSKESEDGEVINDDISF